MVEKFNRNSTGALASPYVTETIAAAVITSSLADGTLSPTGRAIVLTHFYPQRGRVPEARQARIVERQAAKSQCVGGT